MGQDRRDAFERASNPETFQWLGDPERWGGSSEAAAVYTAAPGAGSVDSEQFIRAQVPDLMARSWDLSCQWAVRWSAAPDPAVTLGTELIVDYGTGQSMIIGATLNLDPAAVPRTLGTFNGLTRVGGTIQLANPISATSIAAKLRLTWVNAGAGTGVVTLAATVNISPRALA